MFGFLAADAASLSAEELERYRALYCGVCRSLKTRHGQFSRLTLNYDMTFLALLEASLYEPEEQGESLPCPVHPFSKKQSSRSEATDYAADMNILLAYLKCRDDWDDDLDPVAKLEAAMMHRAYLSVFAKYPRQVQVIEKSLKELSAIESNGLPVPDEASACFGRLMGEIFVMREDRWSGTLRSLGMAMGRFIYVLDACVDLDKDRRKGRYNPFAELSEKTDKESYFRDLLKMLLGEAVVYFDVLPLVQDVGIMKNILCSGLWTQFNKLFKKGNQAADDSGSV